MDATAKGEAKVPPPAPVTRSAYTVKQFVDEHGLGRTRYFALQKAGLGPRTYKIGSRTYISAEAAAEWRATMERRTAEPPAPAVPHKRPFVKPLPSKH